ncbi:MAG: carbohydrate ABC transporter permease [Anaerolineae bacterium]
MSVELTAKTKKGGGLNWRKMLSRVGFALLVLVVVAVTIAPVYFMVALSVMEPSEFFRPHPAYFPTKFTTQWWERVLRSETLYPAFRKSLIVATLTTFIAVVISVPGAYAISRMAPKIKYFLILSLFFTRMYPEIGIALPVAVLFLRMGLYESITGLVFAHLILVLPVCAWILVGAFETIPRDLEEAASVDGASRLGTLWRVVIPLAMPGISVAAIFSWLLSWDEVTYARFLTLLHPTLPIQLLGIIGRSGPTVVATWATIVTIPVVIVTYLMQRWLRAEYLAGAVKG